MEVSFVIFRYQPDLTRDESVPLGVVATPASPDSADVVAACLQCAHAGGVSELASAMLQDVPAILLKELQESCARLRPGEDFLEVLRANSPWNFHFSVPETRTIQTDDLSQATTWLFHQFVPLEPLPKSRAARPKAPRAVVRRKMEVLEFAF
jgi:hypothetical protein